jgi:hypothetical protein
VPEILSEERGGADNRWSSDGDSDIDKLSSRAKAHELIYAHAVAAGMDGNIPEMRQYSRELFFLSRQCGAAGLIDNSKQLLALSAKLARSQNQMKLEFFVYVVGAQLLGWRFMGVASRYVDRMRELW